MKKYSLAICLFALLSSLIYTSCKKINEATTLGGDLIPGVDNVNTFGTELETRTDNRNLNDTSILFYGHDVAIGHLNDPEFGITDASAYFSVGPSSFGIYPFFHRDSIIAFDSVVLSLSYTGSYGDTESVQTLNVYEISPTSGFNPDTGYKFTAPDISITGGLLGSATFQPKTLNDSVVYIHKRDTTKTVNTLRIRLDNSLGARFAAYDTLNSSNGAFRNDSIFRVNFKGLAIRPNSSGNALTYFGISDKASTQLIFYYRVKRTGFIDTAITSFAHNQYNFLSFGGQANIIRRNIAGTNYETSVSTPGVQDEKLYIQTTPFGSYGEISIPGLDTFKNKVIHRAELIVSRVPSLGQDKLKEPELLFLDKISPDRDTAYTLENDMILNENNLYDPAIFGGAIKSNTYRYNITRHVQGIITRGEPNYSFRIYAPLYTTPFVKTVNRFRAIPVLSQIAKGRVVLAGGNHPDPSLRLRLRIVYSNL